MPKFNPKVQDAVSYAAIPGTWLCEIPAQVKLGDRVVPGIEIGQTTKGIDPSGQRAEMWKAHAVVCQDPEHPEAPTGSIVFENLTWDGPPIGEGKGEARIYRLMKCMGYDTDKMKASTTPIDINPEHLYGRKFVMKLKLRTYEKDGKAREGLEADGFMPFLPPQSPRGAAPPGSAASKPAPVGNASFPFGANALPAASPASAPAAPPAQQGGLW